MVWTRRLAPRAGRSAGVCAVLLAAIALTFSQSSLVALLGGLLALAALRWGARWALVAIAVAALAGGALLAASGADLNSVKSLDIRSSGRASLVRGGLELAADRPLAGHGTGSFQVEFERRFPDDAEGTGSISHTEPVTVAAEQGLLGLVPYVALLAAVVGHAAHGAQAAARRALGARRVLRGALRAQPRLRRPAHRPGHVGAARRSASRWCATRLRRLVPRG